MSSWWIISFIIINVHLCLLLPFLAWSLFCLMWLWLCVLSFGCHLLVVSSSIPSLLSPSLSLEPSLLEIAYSWVVFYNASVHSVSELGNSFHLHLGWLLIKENLVLPFYALFSGCSLSPLFLFPFVSVCHFPLVVFYVFSVSSFSIFCVYVLDLCFVVNVRFV